MKEKAKILRVRPFNMANFSGSYGYMPVFAMMAMTVAFPAIVAIWTGIARPARKEDGTLDYQVLQRKLNRVLLPICAALYLLLIIPLAGGVRGYGDILTQGPAILLGAALPTLGLYCALSISAAILNKKMRLFSGAWLALALVLMAAITVVGFQIIMLLSFVGSMLEYPFSDPYY